MGTRLDIYNSKKRHYALKSFMISLVTACVIFIPFIILNGGIFYYYGDFNVQEIPFYQMVHDAVKTGNFGWNHTTDLGSDLISSYSFYLLGSPFFWATIPFPNDFVPYLIGPLLILKFACASLAAFLYLKRYVKNKNNAIIGGLLYAFSGFSIYNVFFFHFHEPMIVFPLLLAALDAFLYDKKRVVFALAVFSACVVNYYFFTGQVVFVIMYYFMLVFTKTYKFRIKEFLLLALEVILGFAATAFILLPSVLGIMGNPRLDILPKNWDAVIYNKPQRYWLIISAFFFPADMPAFPTFTPDSDCKWASVAGWLPLFSMTGVIAYLQLKKRDWIKKIILLLALMAFVPVLNSAFQMLNSSIYYTRWFYMPILMFTLATVRAFEDAEADWNRAVRWTAGITLGMTLLIGLMPSVTENDDGIEEWSIGIANTPERMWMYALIALAGILGFVLIYKKYNFGTKKFFIASVSSVCAITFISSIFIIGMGTAYSSTRIPINKDIVNKEENLKLDGIENVRSDFYECPDNTAMFWKISSINCFQSSVSPSIMEFYESFGITRDVASRPNQQAYGLRSLLSCRYLFDYIDDDDDPEECFINEEGETKMPCWTYLTTVNNFKVYENTCYIPMGFTYDSFITEEEFDIIQNTHRSEAILYSMVLSHEQMQKYSHITGYNKEKYALLYGDEPEKFKSKIDSYSYGRDIYQKVCEQLADNSCSKFEYTSNGFKAEFSNKGEENLLFFSIPYSDGFKAFVNGKETEIEKVNNGLMAILVPAESECEIEFIYNTPGLSTGIIITACSFSLLFIYAIIVAFFAYKKKNQYKIKEYSRKQTEE